MSKLRNNLRHRALNEPPLPADDAIREAAVLMPVTLGAKPEVVFIKRAEHMEKHRGQVAFPGGMWEPGDRDLVDTALRESEEEIALPPDRVEVIAALEPQVTLHSVRVTPFIGLIPEGLTFVPEPGELDAVFQVPLHYLLTDANYTQAQFSTPMGDLDAPCIFYGDYCIWGVTYRIMLDVFREAFDFSPGEDFEPLAIKVEIT